MREIIAIIFLVLLFPALIFAVIQLYDSRDNEEFILFYEFGSVFYKEPGEDNYTRFADQEIRLRAGTHIKTEDGSYARMFLPDNSIVSIDQNSEIKVEVSEKEYYIRQIEGNAWYRIVEPNQNRDFEVKTENSNISATSGIFGVNKIEDSVTRVFVEDNLVEVSLINVSENNNQTVTKELIEASQAFEISTERKDILEIEVLDELRSSFWFERNKAVDFAYIYLLENGYTNFRSSLREKLEDNSNFGKLKLGSPLEKANNTRTEDLN